MNAAFRYISESDMAVLDVVYADYGECADICAAPGVGASDP